MHILVLVSFDHFLYKKIDLATEKSILELIVQMCDLQCFYTNKLATPDFISARVSPKLKISAATTNYNYH